MNEFFERPMRWGSPVSNSIVDEFKNLLAKRGVKYFDVSQFEEIIDFFLNSGEFVLAEKAIEMGLDQHPGNTALLFRKAEYLFHECELQEARRILEELALMEPSNPDLFITLSAVHSRSNDHERAIKQLKMAMQLVDPFESGHIWEAMGYEYMALESFENALSSFKNALELGPNNPDLLDRVYDLYLNDEAYEKGISYLSQLSEKEPYSENVWYYLACLHYALQEFKQAKFKVELCLAIDDDHPDAYMLRGKICYELKLYDEAIGNFKSYLNLTRVTAQILTKIAECYELKGQCTYASFYYQKAIALDPKFGDAHLGLGIVCNMEGRHEEALKSINKAINLNPKQNEYWHFLALCHGKENDFDKAIFSFEKSIELDKDHKITWIDLIDFLNDNHELENGLRIIDRALQIFPKDQDLLIRKTALLFASGRKNSALSSFEHMVFNEGSSYSKILKYYPPIEEIGEVKEILALYS